MLRASPLFCALSMPNVHATRTVQKRCHHARSVDKERRSWRSGAKK